MITATEPKTITLTEEQLMEKINEAIASKKPLPTPTTSSDDDLVKKALDKVANEEKGLNQIHEQAQKIASFNELKKEYSERDKAMAGLFNLYEEKMKLNPVSFFGSYDQLEKDVLRIALEKEADERVKTQSYSTLAQLKEYKKLLEQVDLEKKKSDTVSDLTSKLPDPSTMTAYERYNHLMKLEIEKKKEATYKRFEKY